MNYRHAFHAGNFADVVKHAVLARVLLHLGAKPAPYRVIDTHAGAGLYDLTGPEAGRSCEWQAGIGRLLPAGIADADVADAGSHRADDGARLAGGRIDAAARALLAPYLDAVAARNSAGRLTTAFESKPCRRCGPSGPGSRPAQANRLQSSGSKRTRYGAQPFSGNAAGFSLSAGTSGE